MAEKRTLEERVQEKEEQLQKVLQKAQQYKEQIKQLQARKTEAERKERTHKLIVCGAEISSLYGHVLEQDEVYTLINFLRRQLEQGVFDIQELKKDAGVKQEEPREESDDNIGFMIDEMFDF